MDGYGMPASPPDGRDFWLYEEDMVVSKDGYPQPYLRLSQASVFFFGRQETWLRWMVTNRRDYFMLDGKSLLPFRREPKRPYRLVSLAEIERIGHAFVQSNPKYTIERLYALNMIIKHVAFLWGYLDWEGNRTPHVARARFSRYRNRKGIDGWASMVDSEKHRY